MKLLKATLLILLFLTNFSLADEDGIKFNKLVADFHDNSSYPFLEERDDMGIFFEFAWNDELEKIIIKRNKDNYPIVRFSLFEKNKINIGDIVIQYNNLDL